MKKVLSLVVLFAAFLAAPSSLADDVSAASSLKLGMGAVSSVPKASIKCGEVAQTDKSSPNVQVVNALSKQDRVHQNWSSSGSAKE
jgi:hypothetical protein